MRKTRNLTIVALRAQSCRISTASVESYHLSPTRTASEISFLSLLSVSPICVSYLSRLARLVIVRCKQISKQPLPSRRDYRLIGSRAPREEISSASTLSSLVFHLPLLSHDETKVNAVARKDRKTDLMTLACRQIAPRSRMRRLRCSLPPQIIPRKEEPSVLYIHHSVSSSARSTQLETNCRDKSMRADFSR